MTNATNNPSFQPVQSALIARKRNLPHWQMGGAVYFVTFRTNDLELLPLARKALLDICRFYDGERYVLWSAVVMPDHIHLLIQPREIEKGKWHSLTKILHSIKSFSAKEINRLLNRKGRVWQEEFFDRIIRDEEEFLEKWHYIRYNPVKKGLVEKAENWIGLYERDKFR
ncbi:MAG: transposase [Candidatus Schekmanbacteria bacterium]|nr:transposase [Candidatus Schekmanbacteria bacterium]